MLFTKIGLKFVKNYCLTVCKIYSIYWTSIYLLFISGHGRNMNLQRMSGRICVTFERNTNRALECLEYWWTISCLFRHSDLRSYAALDLSFFISLFNLAMLTIGYLNGQVLYFSFTLRGIFLHESCVQCAYRFQWVLNKSCLLYTSPSPRD